MNIAIDGPAGAGKSTVAQRVAERLDLLYIDTGAMYRAVTWLALHHSVSPENDEALIKLIELYPISLRRSGANYRVYVGEQEVTEQIRTPQVTEQVSRVARNPAVRQKLLELQRQMACHEKVVMDGRDIGTNVLPDAEVKIFLTASIEARANRRYHELISRGYQPDLEQLKEEIALRDKSDSERAIAPLKKADDAETIDTTGLSIDEVVDRIVSIYQRKAGIGL